MPTQRNSAISIPRAALWLVLAAVAAALPAQDFTLEDKPRRYLVIRVEGASRDWQVRPEWISNSVGAPLLNASKGDLALKLQRWERTGLPRRYDTSLWRRAFDTWIGPNTTAPAGARFYFYAIDPRQPRVDAPGVLNLVDERRRLYWVPPQKVTIKAYPATWIDIFEGYVDQFNGEQRRDAVKQWEQAHHELIRNREDAEDGFSPEERNEFASFYKDQFVYIRDRNPKLATIYDELADFYRGNENLDAQLSTYLDALRSGIESPDRERFALNVGRIFVERLQLHEPAIPHLTVARNYSEARHLLARCLIALRRYDDARAELNDLVSMLQAGELTLHEGTSAEHEQGKAWLALAGLEFSRNELSAANAALDRIPQGDPSFEEGRVLYCAMLLHRNLPRRGEEKSDHAKVRDVLKALSFWNEAMGYTAPDPATVFPLNPLMARALLIYAQTDSQFTQTPRPDRPTAARGDVLSMIEAAKALDPLSAEPFLAEFRLQQRLGNFREALDAGLAGLEINPQHAQLHFGVADINAKAGLLAVGKDHFERCLRADPEFYPAMVRMAEIALSDIERIRNSIQVRQAAEETVDVAAELVPPMKEAAAFFTAALEINSNQPATQLALATLQLRLAEIAPLAVAAEADRAELRRAYLSKAHDLASGLARRLEEYATGQKPVTPSERDLAEVPSLACYNVLGYALYNLGRHNEAKAAFGDHITRAADKRYFAATGAAEAYKESAELRYARDWLRRIDENQRQYFDVEEFTEDSREGFYNNWRVAMNPKPDNGFVSATRMRGGKLILGINQRDDNVPSRLELVQPYSTLAAFEAQFNGLGDDYWRRGVFLSKYSKPSSGVVDTPIATLMVGIDSELRVYWETRKFQIDNQDVPEAQVNYGYIDVADYGGVPLNGSSAPRLGIRRQLADDGSELRYFVLINGHQVPIRLQEGDPMLRNDIKNTALKAACGFFAVAAAGTQASTEIERVRFIFDGGLGERRSR